MGVGAGAGAGWRARAQRGVTLGAPAVYVVALCVTVLEWGLPVARDQLFFWLGLGMAAFSAGRPRRLARLVMEWLPIFALLVLYDLLRGAVDGVPEAAHRTAQQGFDTTLFGGDGPTVWLQHRLWDPAHLRPWDYAIWAVYMTHFFAVWTVAAVVWHRAHEHFRRYATLVVLLTLGAFLTYWLYPAQPPWLVANDGHLPPVDRIVPIVWGHLGVHTIQSTYENGALVNPVAAMPSLHAAYPVLLLLYFWDAGRRVRAGLALYAAAMAFTLVYGGEHFFADIAAGWLMAGLVFVVVDRGAPAVGRRTAEVRRRAGPVSRWRARGAGASARRSAG